MVNAFGLAAGAEKWALRHASGGGQDAGAQHAAWAWLALWVVSTGRYTPS